MATMHDRHWVGRNRGKNLKYREKGSESGVEVKRKKDKSKEKEVKKRIYSPAGIVIVIPVQAPKFSMTLPRTRVEIRHFR